MRCLTISLAALAATAAASLPVAAQTTVEFPARKAGHWEISIVTEKPAGAPNLDTQLCIDAATDKELMDFGLQMSKDTCKRYEMKRVGQSVVIDAECKFGSVKTVTRTTMSGNFQSNYTVRIAGTTDGLPFGGAKGPQDTLMVQTARWVGASCPAGMKPGDITLPGGMKINVRQAKQLQKILPQIQIR